MRAKILLLTLAVCVCSNWTPAGAGKIADQQNGRPTMELSSAAKHKQPRPVAQTPLYGPRPHFGGPADPSFGPDGKPYKVPEYLRNQCYIDDGYGRFSPCSNYP